MKDACEIFALHKSKHHGNRGHHQCSHSGDQELVQARSNTLILLHAGEQAFLFFSQQHDGHQAQYKKHQCQECH
jgi:hypothetical protein